MKVAVLPLWAQQLPAPQALCPPVPPDTLSVPLGAATAPGWDVWVQGAGEEPEGGLFPGPARGQLQAPVGAAWGWGHGLQLLGVPSCGQAVPSLDSWAGGGHRQCPGRPALPGDSSRLRCPGDALARLLPGL